jgi:hypothetical protein
LSTIRLRPTLRTSPVGLVPSLSRLSLLSLPISHEFKFILLTILSTRTTFTNMFFSRIIAVASFAIAAVIAAPMPSRSSLDTRAADGARFAVYHDLNFKGMPGPAPVEDLKGFTH